jgi:hypothetical protein
MGFPTSLVETLPKPSGSFRRAFANALVKEWGEPLVELAPSFESPGFGTELDPARNEPAETRKRHERAEDASDLAGREFLSHGFSLNLV